MHPSSFYNLWACYIYTPLYGPYSLSEALEGLISYSLEESQDSISIGLKRTLRHELGNIVDDLQDYLVYFSSKFLIFPINSPNLIKELQASHDKFKHLFVCWGAIVACLVTTRKIVEGHFWPHLFQLAINNLVALQRFGPPSLVLPNMTSKKSFAPMSGFISTSHIDSTPCSPYCPLESQRLPFNVQSERPPSMPSKTNPTGGREGCALSLIQDTTSTSSETRSGPHPTRILSSCQHSDSPFNLRF